MVAGQECVLKLEVYELHFEGIFLAYLFTLKHVLIQTQILKKLIFKTYL